MPGAFEASPELHDDPFRTAEEIQQSGEELLRWLEQVATSNAPDPVDLALVNEIHRRWFETVFPADAGRTRSTAVVNRKGTAVAVEAVLPGVVDSCDNWNWRREHVAPPDDDPQSIAFAVSEANTLTVAVYDVHPYIDGNTRTTWHLRNYLLMLAGLRPLIDLQEEEAYESAWWSATAHDHAAFRYRPHRERGHRAADAICSPLERLAYWRAFRPVPAVRG